MLENILYKFDIQNEIIYCIVIFLLSFKETFDIHFILSPFEFWHVR